MDGLRTTVGHLAGLRRHVHDLKTAGARSAHTAASRLTDCADFGRNPGKLRMLRYVPDSADGAPALLVALHGCTQTAASYDEGSGWSTLAERHGFALLMPEQQSGNNPNLCFNWFEPGHTRRGGGEALSIHQMIKCMIADHGIDASRVFIVGLSAGGAMSAAMLAAYPETFKAGAIIAGLPAGAASNMMEAMEAMRSSAPRQATQLGDHVRRASPHAGPWPRVSVWHGDSDPIVHPQNGEDVVAQWCDVQGLQHEPHAVAPQQGYRRRVWRDKLGTDVIEAFTVSGMSHGVPLGLDDIDNRCGRAGPLHFDVGISSASSIVHFFGIANAAPRDASGEEPIGQPRASAAMANVEAPQLETGATAEAKPSRPLQNGFKDPVDAITTALRQAGLLVEPGAPGAGAALDPHQIIAKVLRSVGVLKK